MGGIWLPEGEFAEEDDYDEFGDLSDDSDSDSDSEGGGTSVSDESDDDDGGDDLGFEIVRRSKSKRSKAAALVDADEEDASVSTASEDASALTRVAESSGPQSQTVLALSQPIAAKPKRKKATVQVAARKIASDDDDDDDFQCTLTTVDSVFRPITPCSRSMYVFSIFVLSVSFLFLLALIRAVIQELNQRAQQTLTSAAAVTDGAEKKRKKAGQ